METNMIDVKDLTFSCSDNPFIESVSFDVRKGQIFGIILSKELRSIL
jgi:ABC-type transporter Mla maintaining outer membrane lipid asymmetry ATPase subunit MlaF